MSATMNSRASSLIVVAGVATVGLLAYAFYFDYKRRNDVQFRKNLRKEKKRVQKSVASSKSETELSGGVAAETLRKALDAIKNDETVVPPEQREQYFMSQVSIGEQLGLQGPAFHLPAAIAFYKALRVYPSPAELMVIYEKTVHPPVFQLVLEMTNLDVITKIEGYYQYFPPKGFDVSVEHRGSKDILVASKDFKAGDVIYRERPVVATLDSDLQKAGTHCTHCLRLIQDGMEIENDDDPILAVYCSKECQLASKTQSQNLLFTLGPILPNSLPAQTSDLESFHKRKNAQEKLVSYISKSGQTFSLLLARFVARQINTEMGKLIPGATAVAPKDYPAADGDYALEDQIERLRYIDLTPSDEEVALLHDLFLATLPGLEGFITDERYGLLKGKIAYNSFGVCYGGGRDDKPPYTGRPEDIELTRTPYGTSRQVGSGLYLVSSYLAHSCAPSSRPSFSTGTSELTLIASKDIKKGDQLTVAYVDVSQRDSESPSDNRRRRRQDLARGWKFACTCERCADEGKTLTGTDAPLPVSDQSKIEPSLERLHLNKSQVTSA